jgi:hypothetical protein
VCASLGRRLKAMMGRKEADILQLISRVVSLQRDMLRPRAVPIIRHTRFANFKKKMSQVCLYQAFQKIDKI